MITVWRTHSANNNDDSRLYYVTYGVQSDATNWDEDNASISQNNSDNSDDNVVHVHTFKQCHSEFLSLAHFGFPTEWARARLLLCDAVHHYLKTRSLISFHLISFHFMRLLAIAASIYRVPMNITAPTAAISTQQYDNRVLSLITAWMLNSDGYSNESIAFMKRIQFELLIYLSHTLNTRNSMHTVLFMSDSCFFHQL